MHEDMFFNSDKQALNARPVSVHADAAKSGPLRRCRCYETLKGKCNWRWLISAINPRHYCPRITGVSQGCLQSIFAAGYSIIHPYSYPIAQSQGWLQSIFTPSCPCITLSIYIYICTHIYTYIHIYRNIRCAVQ